MRARDMYTERAVGNWMVLGGTTVEIPRPKSEMEVDALVDFFIFADIASKVSGLGADTYDCKSCLEFIFKFFGSKEVSKREFHLLSFGLRYAFD